MNKETNKSKVFVVMEAERINRRGEPEKVYDLTPALKFGNLVEPSIFPRTIHDQSMDWLIGQAKKSLDTLTENDYILLIGDPVAMMIVGIIASQGVNNIKFLRWNPKSRGYNVVKFPVWDTEKYKRIKEAKNNDIRERSERVRKHFTRRQA